MVQSIALRLHQCTAHWPSNSLQAKQRNNNSSTNNQPGNDVEAPTTYGHPNTNKHKHPNTDKHSSQKAHILHSCCAVLCCVVPCCVVLCCVVLCCVVRCVVLCRVMLSHGVLCCGVLSCVVCCSWQPASINKWLQSLIRTSFITVECQNLGSGSRGSSPVLAGAPRAGSTSHALWP